MTEQKTGTLVTSPPVAPVAVDRPVVTPNPVLNQVLVVTDNSKPAEEGAPARPSFKSRIETILGQTANKIVGNKYHFSLNHLHPAVSPVPVAAINSRIQVNSDGKTFGGKLIAVDANGNYTVRGDDGVLSHWPAAATFPEPIAPAIVRTTAVPGGPGDPVGSGNPAGFSNLHRLQALQTANAAAVHLVDSLKQKLGTDADVELQDIEPAYIEQPLDRVVGKDGVIEEVPVDVPNQGRSGGTVGAGLRVQVHDGAHNFPATVESVDPVTGVYTVRDDNGASSQRESGVISVIA